MTKSPVKFFFMFAMLSSILGFLLNWGYENVVLSNRNTVAFNKELSLARFYYSTGQFTSALDEYKIVIDTSKDLESRKQAYIEISSIINKQIDVKQNAYFYIRYFLWSITPKVFLISGFFILVWLSLLLIKLFHKKPILAILPITDLSGANLGDRVPQLVGNRLRDLNYMLDNLSESATTLSETLDVPVGTAINDGDELDFSSAVEAALVFVGGPANIPFGNLLDTLRLWLEQPKYLLRGDIRKISNNDLLIHLVLLNRENRHVEKIWDINLPSEETSLINIVDFVIYPLIYHFNKGIKAKRWESFKLFSDGLENLAKYREGGFDSEYLYHSKDKFEKAIELDSGYDLASYNLGLLLLRLGEYERAKNIFKELSSLSIDIKVKEFSLYNYGVSLFQMAQDWSYKRSIEAFKKIVSDSSNLSLGLMANSTLALVYARLAVRAKSDSNSYIQSAFVHIEIIRESRFASKSILSMALAAEGYIKMTLNDLDGSENCFVQSIKMDAGNISGLLGLADIYVKKGNKEKALSVYKEAEFASPSSNYASYKLGNIYRDFGDTENAILAYKRSDNFALAHLELGKIYLSQDEYNDALSAFRFAASKNKKLSDVWANIAWTICEMNPDDHTIIKEAEESARRALLLEENTSNLWHRHAILSRSLYLQNKLDKSLVEVKKAISLAPNQSQAYYYLALIEKELGKFDKVHIAIQKIIELDKKDEWQIKAEALLDQLP